MPLVTVANRQVMQHKRTTAPIFVPFVLSTSGGLGKEAMSLIDSLVSAYVENSRASDGFYDLWGDSLSQRASRFKNQFVFDLMYHAIRGAASSQLVIGTPWSKATSKKSYGNSLRGGAVRALDGQNT